MKFFLNIGRILSVLILGAIMSSFVAISAMAETQDTRFGINTLSGELGIPVVKDSKSFTIKIEYMNISSRFGLIAPDYFHENIYNNPAAGIGNERRIMLNTAYSEPVACLQA